MLSYVFKCLTNDIPRRLLLSSREIDAIGNLHRRLCSKLVTHGETTKGKSHVIAEILPWGLA
jgi:hypothetical protein